MERTIPLPTDEMFQFGGPLPTWVEALRPHQWEAAQRIVEAYDLGLRLVLLDAGTGAGKSLIAELVRRMLSARSVLSCTTKTLQDQYAKDFPYAAVMKGRSNYLTELGRVDESGKPKRYGYSDITCADCTYTAEDGCRWCFNRNFCPYISARHEAELASLAVVNTSLFLTDCNKGKGAFAGRDLAVFDEADLLEAELLNHVEIVVSEARMERVGILPPTHKTAGVVRPGERVGNGEKAWLRWVQGAALPALRNYLAELTPPSEAPGSAAIREYKSTDNLIGQLERLERELPEGGWVYDGYNDGNVIFRPIKVGSYGRELLWPHARRFLLMTATPISAELMLQEIGWEEEYEVVTVPNMFPVENRPVYVCPIANMSYKETEASRGENQRDMVEAVRAVLNRHPNERVLVHTVSYKLARIIKDGLKLNPSAPTDQSNRPIITYTESRGKDEALRNYKAHPNSVLIASSMDRGVDLPGDLCRVQVIAKVPFPNTQDRRINARMFSQGGTAWYRIQAIRTIIQMCGRGMRSKDDQCVTYILDSQFRDNLWQSDHLFPKWFSDAVSFRLNKRMLMRG